MEIKQTDIIAIAFAIIVIIGSYVVLGETEIFTLIAGIAVLAGLFPFLRQILKENAIGREKEEMFLEFSRNLVESVKTGTPISKSIVIMGTKDYGALSPHVKKLGNQLTIGLPLSVALQIFAKDVKNRSIARSLTLIGQAEKAGGEIGTILEAVANSVNVIDKLKKERESAISSLVSQGYIIFLVFIVIILVLQFQIIPMVSGIGDLGGALGIASGAGTSEGGEKEIANAFLFLIMAQGFFTGLTVGKLSGRGMKAGIKHSIILMFLTFIISTIANLIFGG